MRTKNKAADGWQKTHYANLVRYVSSGVYFARLRVRGKLVRKSLKTDVLTTAKLRLGDLEKEERKAAESELAVDNGKLTVAEALCIYRQRLDGNSSLKQRTKDYYAQRIKALLKSWPQLEATAVRKITRTDCFNWASRFSKKASSSSFNHTISLLRHILEIGVETGARYDNPARVLKRQKDRTKQIILPDIHQFDPFVTAIEKSGSRFSKPCANLVRFLAFGGFRKMEAANVTWADCDFAKGEILVRGDSETATKNWEIRRVPMINEMKALLERLKAKRGDEPNAASVMEVRECQKAMDRAATAVGMKRITHHDLRHLFATRCIESGVDIPTVSRWLGHKDGGALAMKVYGHLRDQHSSEMARKVSFSVPNISESQHVE